MMTKHTPGPWRAFKQRVYGPCRDGREHEIANADSPYVQDGEANARLIASAPDLLEAVQKVVNNWGNLHHKDLMQLRAALSKATK